MLNTNAGLWVVVDGREGKIAHLPHDYIEGIARELREILGAKRVQDAKR